MHYSDRGQWRLRGKGNASSSTPADGEEDVTAGDDTALTWGDGTIIEWSGT